MSTEVVNAIEFDESGNSIHVLTLTGDDYTATRLAIEAYGVYFTQTVSGVETPPVFIPYTNLKNLYQ